jgi:hypothetical protein
MGGLHLPTCLEMECYLDPPAKKSLILSIPYSVEVRSCELPTAGAPNTAQTTRKKEKKKRKKSGCDAAGVWGLTEVRTARLLYSSTAWANPRCIATPGRGALQKATLRSRHTQFGSP